MEVNIFIRFGKIILYHVCSFGAKTNRVWEFKTIQIKIKVCFDCENKKGLWFYFTVHLAKLAKIQVPKVLHNNVYFKFTKSFMINEVFICWPQDLPIFRTRQLLNVSSTSTYTYMSLVSSVPMFSSVFSLNSFTFLILKGI